MSTFRPYSSGYLHHLENAHGCPTVRLIKEWKPPKQRPWSTYLRQGNNKRINSNDRSVNKLKEDVFLKVQIPNEQAEQRWKATLLHFS
jgi:hypothetical protein